MRSATRIALHLLFILRGERESTRHTYKTLSLLLNAMPATEPISLAYTQDTQHMHKKGIAFVIACAITFYVCHFSIRR